MGWRGLGREDEIESKEGVMGYKGAQRWETNNVEKYCMDYRMHGVLPCLTTCGNGEEGR